jgi:hypothetical protein
MNEVTSSEERGWALAAHAPRGRSSQGSDGTPYRYPFSLRLVK